LASFAKDYTGMYGQQNKTKIEVVISFVFYRIL